MKPCFVFPQQKFFAIALSGNTVVNRSTLFELELIKYLDITHLMPKQFQLLK